MTPAHRLLMLGALAGTCVLGCAARARDATPPAPAVAISIDGADVSLGAFGRALARTVDDGTSVTDSTRLSVADALLKKTLLAREARRIVDREALGFEIESARRLALVESYRQAKLDTIDVSPERLANLFEWNADKVQISQIVRRTRAEADSVLRALRAGADFADLARRTSIDPESADRGGKWGWLRFGNMLHVDEAVWKLLPGEYAGPIHTFRGWHVIHVDDRQPRDRSIMEQAPNLFNVAYPDHLKRLRWFEWRGLALWRGGIEVDAAALEHAASLIDRGTIDDVPDYLDRMVVARGPDLTFRIADAIETWRRSKAPPPTTPGAPYIRQWLTNRLTDIVIAREATAEGFLESPETREAVDRAEELTLVEALYRREVLAFAEPDSVRLASYFDANPGMFFWRTALDLSIFRTEDTALADSIADALSEGGTSLDAEHVAVRFPRATYTRTGLRHSFEDLPDLNVSIRRGPEEPGTIVGPDALDGQFTVARIEARGDRKPMTLDEAYRSGMLEAQYVAATRSTRFAAYIDSLGTAYHAVVDTATVLSAPLDADEAAVRAGDR